MTQRVTMKRRRREMKEGDWREVIERIRREETERSWAEETRVGSKRS